MSDTTAAAPASTPAVPEKKAEDYIGLVKRCKVSFEKIYGKLLLQEFAHIDVDGAPVLDAFPSTGVVSVLAGMQLVKTMQLPLVGVFSSEDIPMCCTLHNEVASSPARIYGNKTIVVFVCEFQLEETVVPDMVEAIYEFAARHKAAMIYTIEGMPVSDKVLLPSGEEVALTSPEEEGGEEGVKTYIDDSRLAELHMKGEEGKEAKEGKEGEKEDKEEGEPGKHKKKKHHKKKKSDEDEADEEKTLEQKKEELAEKLFGDKIHYLTTNQEMAKKLRELGYIPVVDGIVTNVTGGLLARAPFKDQDVTALLAPTSTLLPSPASAVALLKMLGTLLPGITICTSELEKLKDDIERVMKSVMKALPAGAKNQPPSNLYT